MESFKTLTICTIILNFFIIVGVGHGIGCIGIFEIVFFRFITSENFSLSLTSSYENSIGAVTLFSLAGQILLIISFATKKQKTAFWSKAIGLILLWFGFFYLSHNLFSNDGISQISFFFGLPFLIVSIVLAFRVFKNKWPTASDQTNSVIS